MICGSANTSTARVLIAQTFRRLPPLWPAFSFPSFHIEVAICIAAWDMQQCVCVYVCASVFVYGCV